MSCTGTAASWSRGCRCETCRAAEKARHLTRLRNGEPPYRRTLKARRHIENLIAAGMSQRQVELKSGVDYKTIRDIRSGKAKRILDRTERAILATRPAVDAWCYIDAAPTIARINRMRKQGYSKQWIAEQAGLFGGDSLPKPGNRKCHAFIASRIRSLAEFTQGCTGTARDGRTNGLRALSNAQLAEHKRRTA